MKVFKSMFQHDLRCSSCNCIIHIHMKRRCCRQCQKLFCTSCSVKVKNPGGGIFRHRYCMQCYAIIQKQSRATTKIESFNEVLPESQPERQRSESYIDHHSIKPSRLDHEETKEVSKRIIERRLSTKLPKSTAFQSMSCQSFMNQDPNTHYQVIQEIYSSENVTVYTVSQLSTNTIFTMKKIIPLSQEEQKLIQEETSLHLSSNHENVLRCYSVYNFNRSIFIIQEKHDEILYNILKSKAGYMAEKTMSYICKEVLKGLHYLHSNGRIHRDVKSRNVFLYRTGAVKLGDFGYAAQLLEENYFANHNPSWMAPELLTGSNYNESADIWSLGILLFELAEGVPPYDEEHYDQVIQSILTKPAPRLRNKLKWSKDFTTFISLCLRKEPVERPSAEQLLAHPFIEDNDEETSQEQFRDFISDIF